MIAAKHTFVNTLHDRDYEDIERGIEIAKSAIELTLLVHHCKIVIACDQRWWEYGSAIQMIVNRWPDKDLSTLDVLDVGSGWSGLGPAINLAWNSNVTEYEPVAEYRNDRARTNELLRSLGIKGTRCINADLVNMPEDKFDAVFCISVLEHVPKDVEMQCWWNLADRVRPGGILFITTDVVDDPNKSHIYDSMRVMPNYTSNDMKERVEKLQDYCNMYSYGIPDYNYNGNKVHDFTFFRAGFIKGE